MMEGFGGAPKRKEGPTDEPERVLTGPEKIQDAERSVADMFFKKWNSEYMEERVAKDPSFLVPADRRVPETNFTN